jgi:hypothetical protein
MGGGLHIPERMGMSTREEEAASTRWDTVVRVVDAVNNWGFSDAQSPKVEMPVVTADMLLTPDVNSYTTMYASVLQWFNYSNKLKARIIVELLGLENEMEDIEAETRKRLRRENEQRPKEDKLTAQAINDEIVTAPRYRELKIRAQEVKQLKIEMDARCEELERTLRVVSRNIEVRKEEMGAGRTEGNMPGRTRRPERL